MGKFSSVQTSKILLIYDFMKPPRWCRAKRRLLWVFGLSTADFIKKTLSRVPLCSLPIRSMPKPGHSLVLGGHSANPADPCPQADGHLYPWLLTGSSRDRPIAASARAVQGFPKRRE